mgnify:FL=1
MWVIDAIGSTQVGCYRQGSGYDDHKGTKWCMNNQSRIDDLKRSEGDPDYILFFGGTNDYIDSNFKIDTFIQYYANTVDKLHSTYPKAQIVCITRYDTYYFVFNHEMLFAQLCYGIYMVVSARTEFCKFVNLQYLTLSGDEVDKVGHPKKNGMAAIADEVCKVL